MKIAKVTADLPFLQPNFHEIDAKLQHRFFISKENTADLSTDISDFMVALKMSVERLPTGKNAGEYISMFHHWDLWLSHRFDKKFESNISIPRGSARSDRDSEFLKTLEDHYVIETDVERRSIMERISMLVHRYDNEYDLVASSFTNDKDVHALLITCMESDHAIRNRTLDEAMDKLISICDYIRGHGLNTPEACYIYSWTLHMKGNVEAIRGNVYKAIDKYEQSIQVKEETGLPEFYILRSQLNLSFELTYVDHDTALRLLWKIQSRLEALKALEENTTDTELASLESELYLALGNKAFVDQELKRCNYYLNKSLKLAQQSNSSIRHLNALISLGIADQDNVIPDISMLLDEAKNSAALTNYARRIATQVKSPIMFYNKTFANTLLEMLEYKNLIAA